MLMALCVLLAHAQKKGGAGSQTVDATQVPDSVKVVQAHDFPGIIVTKWELHSGKNPKKGSHYTAQFTDASGARMHARYQQNGSVVSHSTYYDSAHLPAVVATAAKRYPGYTVTGAERIEGIKKLRTRYEVKLKGDAGKKTVKLDDQGNEFK